MVCSIGYIETSLGRLVLYKSTLPPQSPASCSRVCSNGRPALGVGGQYFKDARRCDGILVGDYYGHNLFEGQWETKPISASTSTDVNTDKIIEVNCFLGIFSDNCV